MWKTLITGSVVTGDLMMKLPNHPNLLKWNVQQIKFLWPLFFNPINKQRSNSSTLRSVGTMETWYISIRKYISTTDIDMALRQWVSVNDTVLDRVRPRGSDSHCEWKTHTRPRSVAAGNRHSHATLGIMGNHRKVVLYHNNVDFTATRGQRVKATTV